MELKPTQLYVRLSIIDFMQLSKHKTIFKKASNQLLFSKEDIQKILSKGMNTIILPPAMGK